MIHRIEDEWGLSFRPGKFALHMKPKVFDYIKERELEPIEINFSDVAHKGGVLPRSTRYELADTSFPMIVCEMENPHGLRYRLLDGRHRLHKLKSLGHNSGLFYEVPLSFVINSLVRV